jgi:hypothetical protein
LTRASVPSSRQFVDRSDLAPFVLALPLNGAPAGLTVRPSRVPSVPEVQMKPAGLDSILYVSTVGADSNDGRTWRTAKKTLYRALEALPGGRDEPPTAGSGLVWVADGVDYGGPEKGGGMWLLGARDANFGNPPRGWLRYTGGIRVECLGSRDSAANEHIPGCVIRAGSNADDEHPAVWLSSLAHGLYLEGLRFQYPGVGMRLGIDSNGDRRKGAVQNVELKNTAVNLGNCRAGAGPGIDIGTNTFWIWILDSSIGGCANSSYAVAPGGLSRSKSRVTVTTIRPIVNVQPGQVVSLYNPGDNLFAGSCIVEARPDARHLVCIQPGPDGRSTGGWILTDEDAAVNVDPAGESGSGLLFFRDDVFEIAGPGEGIRFQNGLNGGSLDVKSQTCEGSFNGPSGPCVHVYWNPRTSPVVDVNVSHVESADNNNGGNNVSPAVQVDGPFDPSSITVNNILAGGAANVRGPMTVLGQYAPNLGRTTDSPLKQGQIGFFHNRVVGTTDAARRLFGVVGVRYPNLAHSSSQSWTLNSVRGGARIKAGVPAPDGTTGAARASQESGSQNALIYYRGTQPIAVGDYFIAGVWTKAQSGYNGGLGNFTLQVGRGLDYTSGYSQAAPYRGDGEWEWLFSVQKVTDAVGNSGEVLIASYFGTEQPITAYGPILLHIPAASISDNEAYELAYNLASYDSSCGVGTICALPGQVLQIPDAVRSEFILADDGTPFKSSNVTLSSGWGSRARVSAARGTSQRFVFTVTPSGSGIAPDPTMRIGFPTTWPTEPIFSCKQTGGTGLLTTLSGEDTANRSAMTLSFHGTPRPESSYVFVCEGE